MQSHENTKNSASLKRKVVPIATGDSAVESVVVMPITEPRELTKAKGEVKKLLMNEQKRKS